MDRRSYIRAIGTGLTVGVAGLAGCASPEGEVTVTEGEGTIDEDTVGGGAVGTETEADAVGATETEPAATETEAGTANETRTDQAGTTTGTAAGATNTVSMITDGSDYLFDPIGLYVEPGETITWVNDSGSHSSTAYTEDNPQSEVRRIPEDAEGWNSGILSEEGAEFTHTFEVEGTYDYYCVPHKTLGMVARLVVGEPSGIEGDPPDGPVPSEQRIVEERVVTQEEFNP